MTEKYQPPVEENRDLPMTLARGAAGALPFIGGLLQEIIQTPIEERRQQWMDEVAHGLRKLEEKVEAFDPNKLKDRPEFISAVLHASQVAMRNHQQAKREALRNAVLNVAAGTAPDEDRQMMFLSWIDTFTQWHMAMLRLFHGPADFVSVQDVMAGSLSGNVLERAFPELRGQREFYDQVWRDLRNRGLVNTESLHGMMTSSGLLAKRTTELADEFVKFITSPIVD
jgi:hypothetical protein